MFYKFQTILDSIQAGNRVANAINHGRKPSHSDLRKVGVSEDRIKSDFS